MLQTQYRGGYCSSGLNGTSTPDNASRFALLTTLCYSQPYVLFARPQAQCWGIKVGQDLGQLPKPLCVALSGTPFPGQMSAWLLMPPADGAVVGLSVSKTCPNYWLLIEREKNNTNRVGVVLTSFCYVMRPRTSFSPSV